MVRDRPFCPIASIASLAASAWLGLLGAPLGMEARAAETNTVVTCEQSRTSTSQVPVVPTQIDASCATIPLDFAGAIEQPSFDLSAWLTFIAVNWPVDPATCAADGRSSILTNPSQPVWLSYATDTSVFVPAGQTPAPWCAQPSGLQGREAGSLRAEAATAQRLARIARLPEKVRPLAEAHPEVSLFLSHNAKGAGLLHAREVIGDKAELVAAGGILQATGQPVVDQNGRFARYSLYMNRDEYDYLVSNTLWTQKGQAAIETISFPASDKTTGTLGAIELKAAWKVIGGSDDPSRFLTQQAIVYNDENGDPSPGANPVTVGLVGLHLIHKTQSSPEWIWATFAQVDNDATSFFNASCTDCKPNQPPTLVPYVELDSQGKPLNPPTQVVAVVQPDPAAASFNTTFQGLLQGTPWAYYKLISAQWTGEFGNTPKPPQLGNSVIETYVTPGPATYGCLQCHDGATASPSNKPSDRSFIINAQQ